MYTLNIRQTKGDSIGEISLELEEGNAPKRMKFTLTDAKNLADMLVALSPKDVKTAITLTYESESTIAKEEY